MRKLLKNLENDEITKHKSVLETQAHLINFRRHQILNKEGIREINLRRNKFKDGFALALQKCLQSDKYIRSMDLSGNRIGKFGLKVLMKLGLLENQSVICFDARLNPGFTPKIKKQFALCMLKNIEILRNKGLTIK